MSGSVAFRKCETLDEFHRCVELQRAIWGEADLEVEPPTMFMVASRTGGQVLGAFDGEKLVGYTLAVVGWRDGTPFLHSHMTGVDAAYRSRGVGHRLKLFQREDALLRGIRLIEWTFDPFEVGNAYFNFHRLGAICRRYLPNAYGITTSPLHRGLATDRLVAEWHLDSARTIAAIQNLAKDPMDMPATIHLPPNFQQWLQEKDTRKLQQLQSRIGAEFTNWFAKGYAVIGVRSDSGGSSYLLAPWSDF